MWNISSVTSLENTFRDTEADVVSIESWDTSNVESMESTFRGTKLFTGTILKNWNTLSVTDLSYTFYDAISFEGNVEKFNVDNVVRSDFIFGKRNSLSNCKCSRYIRERENITCITHSHFSFYRARTHQVQRETSWKCWERLIKIFPFLGKIFLSVERTSHSL
jgi:hypothetical protein